MAFGFIAVSAALYLMATNITLGMDFRTAAMLRTYQMIGVPFILIPQMTAAYIGISPEKRNQVSSINNFVYNVGGGIGIALVNIAIARSAQRHQSYLVARATPGTPAYETLLGNLKDILAQKGMGGERQAHGIIAHMVTRQATTMAYVDVVSVMAIVVVCLTPFVLLMQGRPHPKDQKD
jgi:DHA2 family multidrug resistance protein